MNAVKQPKPALTIKEVDRIRERMRPAQEKAAKERQLHPIQPKKEALVFVEMGRYVDGGHGTANGLFYVKQWIYEEGKEPAEKLLADGVDAHICGVQCRAALDKAAGEKRG